MINAKREAFCVLTRVVPLKGFSLKFTMKRDVWPIEHAVRSSCRTATIRPALAGEKGFLPTDGKWW